MPALIFGPSTYIHDRRYILCNCLERTLGSVTVDAYAVPLSVIPKGDVKQDVTELLESYVQDTGRRVLLLSNKLALDRAVSIAS